MVLVYVEKVADKIDLKFLIMEQNTCLLIFVAMNKNKFMIQLTLHLQDNMCKRFRVILIFFRLSE